MSIDIIVHARHGLELVKEYPTNSLSMTLRPVAGFTEELTSFLLYTSLDQWFQLRKLLPKAEGYTLAAHGDHPFTTIQDHAEADAWAENFYRLKVQEGAEKEPAPTPDLPEPNAQDDTEALLGHPVMSVPFTPMAFTPPTDTEIADMPPEAPGTDDIVDPERPPVEGDLRGEYESREIYTDGVWHSAPFPRPQMKPIVEGSDDLIF